MHIGDIELLIFINISGLEEFEAKVDKIANGQVDNSWIGQLYQQFSSNIDIDGYKIDDYDIGGRESLEPLQFVYKML